MIRRLAWTLVAAWALSAAGCSDQAPELLTVTKLTNTTSTIGPYEVVAVVVDSGRIDRVELIYRLDGGPWIPVPMDRVNDTTWVGRMPGQPVGTLIEYEVAALDDDREIGRFPADEEVLGFEVIEALP